MRINRRLQGENRERKKEVWEMKKSFFMSAGFASANKGRCQSGLSGRRHVGHVQVWMGCKPCRLKTYSMYVGRSQGAADRQRWTFPNMPLTDKKTEVNCSRIRAKVSKF